jgi:hypothetical protein
LFFEIGVIAVYWIQTLVIFVVYMMPPKKTQTVAAAYIAKCTKCLKKHSPPVNDDCLALVHPDLAKLSDDPDDDENDPKSRMI